MQAGIHPEPIPYPTPNVPNTPPLSPSPHPQGLPTGYPGQNIRLIPRAAGAAMITNILNLRTVACRPQLTKPQPVPANELKEIWTKREISDWHNARVHPHDYPKPSKTNHPIRRFSRRQQQILGLQVSEKVSTVHPNHRLPELNISEQGRTFPRLQRIPARIAPDRHPRPRTPHTADPQTYWQAVQLSPRARSRSALGSLLRLSEYPFNVASVREVQVGRA